MSFQISREKSGWWANWGAHSSAVPSELRQELQNWFAGCSELQWHPHRCELSRFGPFWSLRELYFSVIVYHSANSITLCKKNTVNLNRLDLKWVLTHALHGTRFKQSHNLWKFYLNAILNRLHKIFVTIFDFFVFGKNVNIEPTSAELIRDVTSSIFPSSVRD